LEVIILKQFRLPRKVKKSLKGNLWLYPANEKGNSVMASPSSSWQFYEQGNESY
jgi:hypothetical protein